ncbi:MAG: hypothetical protein ACREBG_14390, partial [Pyrinomonadaceae bacterium]
MERISDFYLLYPFATIIEASDFLTYKPRFISAIKNSDAFQRFHMPRARARQEEAVSSVLGLKEKLTGVVEQTLEILAEKISDYDPDLNPMPVSEMLNVVETGMKRLGYGEAKAPQVQL